MRHSLIHIVLSLLLSIAVTNCLWVDFLDEDQVVAELESESEQQESEKELREDLRSAEDKHNLLDGDLAVETSFSFSGQRISSGFVKHGNSFCPLSPGNHPGLYILYQQLRLPC